jgi:hypothetical protein
VPRADHIPASDMAEHHGEGRGAPTTVVGIDEDVLCVGCGYDLRGLADSACCPECAEIGPSLEAHRHVSARPLHLSDRRWLRRLTAGTACLFMAALVPHLLVVRDWFGWLVTYRELIASVIALLACLLVSAAEPNTSASVDPKWKRWVLRACATAPLLIYAAHTAIGDLFRTSLEFPLDAVWRYVVAFGVHGAPYLAVPASYLLYDRLAAIMRRMTAGRSLHRQAIVLRVLVPTGMMVFIVGALVADQRLRGGWFSGQAAIAGVGIPSGLLYLTAVGLRLALLDGYDPWRDLDEPSDAVMYLGLALAGISALWAASFAAGATLALWRELRRKPAGVRTPGQRI